MSRRNSRFIIVFFIGSILLEGCGLFDIFSIRERPVVPTSIKGAIQGYVFAPISPKKGRFLPLRQSTPPPGYEPLKDATVTVTGTAETALTDANGYYKIDNIIAGFQTVTIFKAGYEPVSFSVEVKGGQTVWAGLKDGQTNLVQKTKKWTFMVYMNADNSLDTAGIDDLNEMEMVGSTDEVNIIVQFDRYKTGTWTATRRYYVIKDNDPEAIGSLMLEELGELDMGSPQTLKDFVQWGIKTYPANHYCLVFWDHGSGWRKRPKIRGISFDDTQKTVLKVSELKEALNVGVKLDLVVIDECVMQMVEVAYELKDYANFIAASEEVEPQDGLPYDMLLKRLVNNPNISPDSFAIGIAQDYLSYYSNYQGLTYSVVNLANIGELAQKVSQFGQVLKDKIVNADTRSQIDKSRRETQSYSGYPDYRDLYHFADRVDQNVADTAIKLAAGQVKEALKSRAVLFSGTTGGTYSEGLSIYLPAPSEFPLYASQYAQLRFSKETLWDDFLEVF